MSTDECCGHHEIESIHSNYLSDLSEAEQESLAGGFFYLFANQREIFSNVSNQTNFSGSIPVGGSGNSSMTANSSSSTNSNYYLRESTFLLSSSTDVPFTVLPRLLKWLSSSMG
jgi:hypothetical protein